MVYSCSSQSHSRPTPPTGRRSHGPSRARVIRRAGGDIETTERKELPKRRAVRWAPAREPDPAKTQWNLRKGYLHASYKTRPQTSILPCPRRKRKYPRHTACNLVRMKAEPG